MYIRTLKPLKTRKEKEELKCKHPGSTNYRNYSDVIVSGVIVTESNGDVTMRDEKKTIARKRYAQKHSFVSKKGFIKSSLRVCSQTFTKIAFILAMVISILGGLCNIKLLERKNPIGTSPSVSPSEHRVMLSFLDSSVLSNLRESTATIIGTNEGLCSCIHKGMFLNNNKQLIRCMKVLQNTIICEETIPDYATYASPSSLSVAMVTRCPFCKRSPERFLAEKCLVTYIFPFSDFWASRVYYFDAYTVNLELDDNFKVFFDLVYLYIFIFFIVRGHPATGQHTPRLF